MTIIVVTPSGTAVVTLSPAAQALIATGAL